MANDFLGTPYKTTGYDPVSDTKEVSSVIGEGLALMLTGEETAALSDGTKFIGISSTTDVYNPSAPAKGDIVYFKEAQFIGVQLVTGITPAIGDPAIVDGATGKITNTGDGVIIGQFVSEKFPHKDSKGTVYDDAAKIDLKISSVTQPAAAPVGVQGTYYKASNKDKTNKASEDFTNDAASNKGDK